MDKEKVQYSIYTYWDQKIHSVSLPDINVHPYGCGYTKQEAYDTFIKNFDDYISTLTKIRENIDINNVENSVCYYPVPDWVRHLPDVIV